jgi:hypothetical protein
MIEISVNPDCHRLVRIVRGEDVFNLLACDVPDWLNNFFHLNVEWVEVVA